MTREQDRSSRLLVITGATATGKTRLAVELASALGSEILSADSRQVYRRLDIGTGKDLEEYSTVSPAVPYHLIDIAEPESVYTVYHFQRDCYQLIEEKRAVEPFASGTPLVMVGGTALYLAAVLLDYRIPNVPDNPALRRELEQRPLAELVEQLRGADAALFERTDLSTQRRVVRALEIAAYSKTHPPTCTPSPTVPIDALVCAVKIDRKQLHQRIDQRLDERLEEGMVDEVRDLLERGLTHERLGQLGLEYGAIGAYLAGEKTYDQMVTELKFAIHRFARRQEVWYRGFDKRGIPVNWIEAVDADAALELAYARWPDLRR